MIDNLALGISHGLLLLTAWILLRRPELDQEDAAPRTRFGARKGGRPVA